MVVCWVSAISSRIRIKERVDSVCDFPGSREPGGRPQRQFEALAFLTESEQLRFILEGFFGCHFSQNHRYAIKAIFICHRCFQLVDEFGPTRLTTKSFV